MEKIILRSLDYDISIPSPVLFLQRKLASLTKVPPLLKPLSTYLLDLGLVASQLPASASQAAFGALLCAASILQVFRMLYRNSCLFHIFIQHPCHLGLSEGERREAEETKKRLKKLYWRAAKPDTPYITVSLHRISKCFGPLYLASFCLVTSCHL